MYNNKFFGQKVAEGNRISMKINISLQKFNFHLNITWVFPLQSQYILLRRNICVLGSDGRGYEFQSGLGRPKNSISVGFSIDKKVKLKNICYAFLSYAGILIKNPHNNPSCNVCLFLYVNNYIQINTMSITTAVCISIFFISLSNKNSSLKF